MRNLKFPSLKFVFFKAGPSLQSLVTEWSFKPPSDLFHKSFCARVKMPADYAPRLAWKVTPSSAKWMFFMLLPATVDLYFIGFKYTHSYRACDCFFKCYQHVIFLCKLLCLIYAGFWRGTRQIQVMKLKFVQVIKFWLGAVSTPTWNLSWMDPCMWPKCVALISADQLCVACFKLSILWHNNYYTANFFCLILS